MIATTNRDKLAEIRRILGNSAPELMTLRDFPSVAEPDETGTTFAENARLKAVHYDRALAQVRATDPSTLLDAREVGRARLPSTVVGLLFHAAEHTQRHVGQLVTTAKVVRGAVSW